MEADDTPRRMRMSMAMPLPSSTMPISKCSVDTYVWLFSRATRNERTITLMTSGVKASLAASVSSLGSGTVVWTSLRVSMMSS